MRPRPFVVLKAGVGRDVVRGLYDRELCFGPCRRGEFGPHGLPPARRIRRAWVVAVHRSMRTPIMPGAVSRTRASRRN